MLNLQLLQKERARLYKQNILLTLRNDLRKQFEQKQQMRKNQSMQLKSRDQEELKQKLDIAMNEMRYEKQREFYMNNKLKQENIMLASLKNMNTEMEQSFIQQTPLKGSSLLETLYQHNDKRGSQHKNIAKKLSQSYQQEENIHKMANKEIKTHELNEDQRHLERLKQMEDLRRQQYEQIKSKHSPEPKAGELHRRLQQMNEDYKRSLESFAYNGRDILDSLKRDESKQVFQRSKRVQSEIKSQIEEKKLKDQIEKQDYVGQPDDLKKSILGSILFKGPNFDKRQYADYLMKQINETDLRRSTQKIENKQKIQISSIFGGQGGPERLKMIKYIDKNLGIESDYLKNVEPGNKSSSPYRMKNLYEFNGQNSPIKGSIPLEERSEKLITNPEKSYTEESSKNDIKERKSQSSNDQTIKLSSSLIGEHSPKSYLGYDLIKGSSRRYEY